MTHPGDPGGPGSPGGPGDPGHGGGAAGPRADKQTLRSAARASRRALGAAERVAAEDGIARVAVAEIARRGAGTVAGYASIGTEPGTRALLDALHRAGVRVLLPLLREDLGLDWCVYQGPERLRRAPHGLDEPDGPRLPPETLAEAEIVLVPALAADPAGHRLGRGAGCYDRALAHARDGAPLWAVLYDGELVAQVPAEPHDRPVDAVLTPSGLRPAAPRAPTVSPGS